MLFTELSVDSALFRFSAAMVWAVADGSYC
jgi:hypothetical protein